MQFIIENHKIYAQNEAGERLAEVDFPTLDEIRFRLTIRL